MIPQPKPEPRKRTKARAARRAAKVVKSVRQQCVERDGYCRMQRDFNVDLLLLVGVCQGESQWAHFDEKKRFKTRGMKPETRHTTEGSLMLCQWHHDRYDGKQRPSLHIMALTSRGADGPLCMLADGRTHMERG